MKAPGPRAAIVKQAILQAREKFPDASGLEIAAMTGASAAYVSAIDQQRAYAAIRASKVFAPLPMPLACEQQLRRACAACEGWLRILSDRVTEAKDILPASEWCRWFLASGLVELFVGMDGDGLRKRAEALLGVCNERFTSGDKAPQFAVLQMQSLDERMQRIEQLLSKQAA